MSNKDKTKFYLTSDELEDIIEGLDRLIKDNENYLHEERGWVINSANPEQAKSETKERIETLKLLTDKLDNADNTPESELMNIVKVASSLRSQGDNPEYDRALVELTNSLVGEGDDTLEKIAKLVLGDSINEADWRNTLLQETNLERAVALEAPSHSLGEGEANSHMQG